MRGLRHWYILGWSCMNGSHISRMWKVWTPALGIPWKEVPLSRRNRVGGQPDHQATSLCFGSGMIRLPLVPTAQWCPLHERTSIGEEMEVQPDCDVDTTSTSSFTGRNGHEITMSQDSVTLLYYNHAQPWHWQKAVDKFVENFVENGGVTHII